MKVTVREDGSLLIDGMSRTTIKMNGGSLNNPGDMVEGLTDEQVKNSEMINFIFDFNKSE